MRKKITLQKQIDGEFKIVHIEGSMSMKKGQMISQGSLEALKKYCNFEINTLEIKSNAKRDSEAAGKFE